MSNPVGRTQKNTSASLGSMPNPAGFSSVGVLCSCGCVSLRGLIVPQSTVRVFGVVAHASGDGFVVWSCGVSVCGSGVGLRSLCAGRPISMLDIRT